MIKIWLLYLLISMPNMPSVRNNSFIYPTEEACMQALADYLNIYESKSLEYKENLKTTGYCLPFDAFPIQGMNKLKL
tara:strand:- start:110 stop:340 length:231 start_codon:yes stop_codon:yes gene_type:complete